MIRVHVLPPKEMGRGKFLPVLEKLYDPLRRLDLRAVRPEQAWLTVDPSLAEGPRRVRWFGVVDSLMTDDARGAHAKEAAQFILSRVDRRVVMVPSESGVETPEQVKNALLDRGMKDFVGFLENLSPTREERILHGVMGAKQVLGELGGNPNLIAQVDAWLEKVRPPVTASTAELPLFAIKQSRGNIYIVGRDRYIRAWAWLILGIMPYK